MVTAMVTGGTSGIGASFARQLAQRGDNLVLVARDEERLASMAAEITGRFAVEVETLSADLAVREDVDRVAARLIDPERPVDVLVNNAGFGVRSRLVDPDLGAHDKALAVMVWAVLQLSGAAAGAMKARGHGSIVNVSSTAGFVLLGHYSALKSWVTVYTESLALELAGTGVTATALCPGWVHTEFHQRAGINKSKIPAPLWLDADRVVEECLHDVAAGRQLSIPSKRYKVLMTILRYLPTPALRVVSAKINGRRH